MAQCDITNTTVSNGIQDYAAKEMDRSGLFDRDGNLFTVKNEDSNHEQVVDEINSVFREELVMRMGTMLMYGVSNPSDELIDRYLRQAGVQSSKDNIFLGAKEIPKDELKEFRELQKLGLVSNESNTVDGKQYFKIPGGKDPDQYHRLIETIKRKGLDFINVTERPDFYMVEVGEIEQTTEMQPQETPLTAPSKKNTITKNRVLRFLENIGFQNIQILSQLMYKGKELTAAAYIDFATGTMQIKEGQEDYYLTEEAMHVLTQLIKQSRPQLYAKMKSEVINYKLYRELVNDPDYINRKDNLYKNEDGSLNYDKLKEEAVTKVLAEYLANQLEPSNESARRLETVRSWWEEIVDWIREKFGMYKNPFKEAMEQLDQNDRSFGEFADMSSDDIFLGAKPISQIDSENPDTATLWNSIKNNTAKNNISKIDFQYFKDNKPVSEEQRVSNLVNIYYKKLFGDRNFDETQKEFYEMSRQDGTYLHEVLEAVIKSWIDPITGLMRKNPESVSFPLPGNPVNKDITEYIKKFVPKFLLTFEEGTRFLIEQVIYDPGAVNSDKSIGRFGTVDFIAIRPSDKGPVTDIYDWKSMLIQDMEGAKDYKKGAIYIQLREYARILKDAYGVNQFGRLRAVPIDKRYKFNQKTQDFFLSSVQIGDADPAKISSDKRFLRPIISPDESTKSEAKDVLISKLQALYQKYIDKGYFQEDITILNDIQEAIYEVRVKNTVDNLSNYFTDLSDKFTDSISELSKLDDANKEEVTEALALIAFYEDIIDNVVTPALALAEDPLVDPKSGEGLKTKASTLLVTRDKLRQVRNVLLDKLAKKNNVFDLLLPEKVVNLAKRWLRSMGSQDVASIRFMYEMVKKSFERISLKTDEDLKKLKDLKFEFEKWRKDNNLSEKEALGMLVNMEKGNIHPKISKDFFDMRKKIVQSKDPQAILKFVKDNYDLTEYDAWYKKTLAENKKAWEKAQYSTDTKKNEAIIKKKISTFVKNYNIYAHPLTAYGFHNKKIWTKNLKEDKWLSEPYKKIQQYPALLNVYNYMLTKNKELAETGALKDTKQYTFFPNVRKGFADIVAFDETNLLKRSGSVLHNWYYNQRKSITVEDYEMNFAGATDAFSGERLDKRFVPYITNIDVKEQSFDIFKVYGLMSKEINKEKYLQENDEVIRALYHMEKMKPTLQQNLFGKISFDTITNKAETSKELGKNAPILLEHMKAVVGGQQLQYDADYVVQFKLKELWNKTPMAKWYGGKFAFDLENYNPDAFSLTKIIMKMNNFNTKRMLGVNVSAALSNLFGGTFASNRLYSKYIGKNDIVSNFHRMVSGNFYATEDMKKRAALVDYLLPLLNNRESFKASQLSVSEAAKVLSQEWLMAPMRYTSEIVQLNVALAFIDNTGLIEGKLVNLRDKAATELDYYNRHNLPYDQIKDVEVALEKKLEEYKKQYGLAKTVQYKTIKEGGKDKLVIDIPGLDRFGSDVETLRDLIQTMSKDALGEADEFDLANYKYSIWGRLFMTFINWIPRQWDVRMGEFRYDQAHHSHEYGRFRMFGRALSANLWQTMVKLVPVPYLTGKVTDYAFTKEALIQRAKEIYQKKIAEADKLGRYDPETFITQGEFIDKYIRGVDSTFEEFRWIVLFNLAMFFGLAAPDDDDDSETKAWKALLRKQIDKLSDEVGFFYNPKSFIDVLGNRPPVLSMVRDSYNLLNHANKQFFGFTMEQTGWTEKGLEMQEKAKPVKMSFKVFPVFKEFLTYLPTWDEDVAKDWGVRVKDRRGF